MRSRLQAAATVSSGGSPGTAALTEGAGTEGCMPGLSQGPLRELLPTFRRPALFRECSAVAHRAGGPMTAVARPRRRLHGGSSGWPSGAGWNTALVTFGYTGDHRPRAHVHSVGPWPRTWKFVNPDLGRPGMTRTRSPHSPGPRDSLPDGEDSRSQIGTTDWCAHSTPVGRRPERWVRTVLVASRVSSTPDGLLVRFDLPGGEAGVHRRQTSRRRLVGS